MPLVVPGCLPRYGQQVQPIPIRPCTPQVLKRFSLISPRCKQCVQGPGSKALRSSHVDVHHGIARFAWHGVQADGATLPDGLDLAFVSLDGAKIERIIGFFGPLWRESE